MNEPVDITSGTMDALQDTTRCIHCGMTRAQHFTPPLAPHLPPPALGHCIGYKAAPPKAMPSELHSRSAQRRVAAMTPPREPRTAANRARIVLSPEDLATINAGGSVPITIADADLRPVRLAIDAEAAGAPLREALERLRDWTVWLAAHDEGKPCSWCGQTAQMGGHDDRCLVTRSRAALAASSYFGQPPPDDWEDMPADATPAPAALDVTTASIDVEALASVLKAEGFVRGVASRYGTFNDAYWQQSAAAIIAALTARAAATEDTE